MSGSLFLTMHLPNGRNRHARHRTGRSDRIGSDGKTGAWYARYGYLLRSNPIRRINCIVTVCSSVPWMVCSALAGQVEHDHVTSRLAARLSELSQAQLLEIAVAGCEAFPD